MRCWAYPGWRSGPGSGSRPHGRSWRRTWCWRRRWCRALKFWDFHLNSHRRSCLKETYRRALNRRWLIRVEPKIIQCAPANRIGVLVLRKCFAVPHHTPSNIPRSAAIPLVIKRAVICPAGMLRRRVKSDIADASGKYRYPKGLYSAVQVHVKDGVFIMPDAVGRSRHLVTDEENPVVARIGFDWDHRCPGCCPGFDSSLHSHRVTSR